MVGRKMTMLLSYVLILIHIFNVRSLDNSCISNTSRILITNLISRLSDNQTITVDKLRTLYDTNRHLNNSTSLSYCTKFSSKKEQKECFLKQCISIEAILNLHSIPNEKALTVEDVYTISPDLLYQVSTCNGVKHMEDEEHKRRPPSGTAWGLGFLAVTIINMCSLAGAVVLPCMKKNFYKKVLIYLVALAVGTLSATSLLVLTPEALGLMYTDDDQINSYYIWKTSTVIGGIYLFFLLEKFLKAFVQTKQSEKHSHGHIYSSVPDEINDQDHHYSSIRLKTPVATSRKYSITKLNDIKLVDGPSEEQEKQGDKNNELENVSKNGIANGKHKEEDTVKKKPVATVAWMIIFGDGFHNFIDGLTIGAAFTDSILAGVSISVSCFCEELPHELGDFAILLNSGMTIKKALFFNFLSACTCYLGLVAGTLLGENTTAHDWIFAIAGGMFLYISLVDMMPEMSNDSESDENKKNIGGFQIFILQNLGMISGFAIILVMALYGGEINFEE